VDPLAVSPDLFAFVGRLASGTDGGADLFAETFLSLDPVRSTVATREQLRSALPQRRALFESAGIRRTRLESVDVHPLDDRHQLAKTTWTTEFDDPQAQPVTLRSTFLLRRNDGSWRVLVYLNHDDIGAELARRTAG
jgi:hypothetical protein